MRNGACAAAAPANSSAAAKAATETRNVIDLLPALRPEAAIGGHHNRASGAIPDMHTCE
jgi:hypothetical protein